MPLPKTTSIMVSATFTEFNLPLRRFCEALARGVQKSGAAATKQACVESVNLGSQHTQPIQSSAGVPSSWASKKHEEGEKSIRVI